MGSEETIRHPINFISSVHIACMYKLFVLILYYLSSIHSFCPLEVWGIPRRFYTSFECARNASKRTYTAHGTIVKASFCSRLASFPPYLVICPHICHPERLCRTWHSNQPLYTLFSLSIFSPRRVFLAIICALRSGGVERWLWVVKRFVQTDIANRSVGRGNVEEFKFIYKWCLAIENYLLKES